MSLATQIADSALQVNSYGHARATQEAPVLLNIGDFVFSTSTLAYRAFTHNLEWRWAEQQRIGQGDLLQYTGYSQPTVTFEGEAHAAFRNGDSAWDDLVIQAKKNEPLLMCSADGDVFGYWVIKSLSRNIEKLQPNGAVKHMTFTLGVQHYADDLQNP